jgi:hypothetical protein
MTDKVEGALRAFADAAKAFGRNSSAANYVLMEAAAIALQEARYVASQARRARADDETAHYR